MADVDPLHTHADPCVDESIAGSNGKWVLFDVRRPLLLNADSEAFFRPGWHSFFLEIRILTEDLTEPSLYPDYGDGFWEQDRIPLKHFRSVDGSSMRGIICLSRPARAIRFSASLWSRARLTGELHLRKIGRFHACLSMMHLVDDAPGLAPMPVRMMRALQELTSNGVRGLGEWLYKNEIHRRTSPAAQISYRDWLERFDNDVNPLPIEVGSKSAPPLFSIIVPVFNTPSAWLHACVDSVLAQSYGNWQLCIADDASTSAETVTALAKIEIKDARIEIVRRQNNGHISAASNSALELAAGEFVALLDHDDLLHPQALAEFYAMFRKHPHLALVYSDEDKIDQSGRSDPYFKPDFDLDLFRGHNCVSHLTVYRREVVKAVGGFRVGLEGSQDWDLALRVIEKIGIDRVGHIPRVLYHWRKSAQSTALSPRAKNYAGIAALRAINDHLERTLPGAVAVEIEGQPGNFRTLFPLPLPRPRVSVVIPTRDNPEFLLRCVRTVVETTPDFDLELLIMDNGSVELESIKMFRHLSIQYDAKIFRDESVFNYSALNNRLVKHATGEIVLFLNDDIEALRAGWLEELVALALRADVGAVGAKLFYPDGSIQHAGIILGLDGVAANALRGCAGADPGMMNRSRLQQGLSAVTGACLCMRRSLFEEIGGFDEALEVTFNDVDLCLRLRTAGMLVIWTPFAELLHHESVSRGADVSSEASARAGKEERLMRERWKHWIEWDPAYNPNLSITGDSFTLAVPPRLYDRG